MGEPEVNLDILRRVNKLFPVFVAYCRKEIDLETLIAMFREEATNA